MLQKGGNVNLLNQCNIMKAKECYTIYHHLLEKYKEAQMNKKVDKKKQKTKNRL